MQIISPAQCRAARAILNWSQPELAERCDIHVQTISNFEKEESSPSKTTLEKIHTVLKVAGIALLEDDGVKRVEKIVSVLEGQDSLKKYLDTIYYDLKEKPGSEILISGLSEAPEGSDFRSFVEMHLQRLRDSGVSERLLIKEGDQNLIADKSWYRHIPKKYFAGTTFQLHENKLALREEQSEDSPERIVIIESKLVAEAFRKLFNFAWDNCKEVK